MCFTILPYYTIDTIHMEEEGVEPSRRYERRLISKVSVFTDIFCRNTIVPNFNITKCWKVSVKVISQFLLRRESNPRQIKCEFIVQPLNMRY